LIRITSVTAHGFKQKPVSAKLDPVTLIVGPNGSGKSAILESISYAITGHVSGVKATEIGLLLPDPKTVSVLVEANAGMDKTVTLSRGIQSKKRYAKGRAFTKSTGDSAEAGDSTSVASFVVDHFGPHAELFLQAFDPDKNIWSLSAEARLSWTFGIVAHASGWTKDKLGKVFSGIGYGNIEQGRDVVECLDINIRGAAEWARNTAKSVREYEAILAGLTDAISEPKPDEIAAAKRDVKELRDKFSMIEAKTLRDNAVAAIADAEADLEKRKTLHVLLERIEAEHDTVLRERKERQEDMDAVELRRQGIERHYKDVELALSAIEERGLCPTCGAAYGGVALNELSSRWLREQRERETEIRRLAEIVNAWHAEAPARKRETDAYSTKVHDLLGQGAGGVVKAEKDLAILKDKLSNMPDGAWLDEDVPSLRAKLEEAEAKLDEIQNRLQLATERAKKTTGRDKANAAAVLWKGRHEELQDVRGHILKDARRAVDAALDHEIDDIVAPHGGRWKLDLSDETGIDIAYELSGGSFVKYKGMSSGEKIVATVVLLTALRRLLGETPWSALLVDNLELTSYAERVKLVNYVSTLSKLFSNIILLSSDTRSVGTVASIVFE
jgi:DNA repair exonuclease SbcCD ATPase subunit